MFEMFWFCLMRCMLEVFVSFIVAVASGNRFYHQRIGFKETAIFNTGVTL